MLSTLLSIFLLILKIIGILLLVLLGIILIILLVPIRYDFAVSDKAEEKLNASAGVSWLLSILSLRIQYAEKTMIYYLKIAGITLKSNDPEYIRKKKQKKKEAKKKKPKKDSGSQKTKDSENKEESSMDSTQASTVESDSTETAVSTCDDEQAFLEDVAQKEEPKEAAVKKKTEKKDFSAKKESSEEKPSFLERISSKVDSIGQKLDGLNGKIEELKNMAEEYELFKVLQILKNALIHLLKHILPYKIRGWLHFGFDDPSLTGKVTAAAAVFYPRYRKSFSLEPDFQEKCFEGDCSGKGRIRLGYLLWILIALLIKKEIRKIIKYILKHR